MPASCEWIRKGNFTIQFHLNFSWFSLYNSHLFMKHYQLYPTFSYAYINLLQIKLGILIWYTYSLSVLLFQLLSSLGVEMLILPAIPELVQTWTTRFGFTNMSNSDRLKLKDYMFLNFLGSTMCYKFLAGNENQLTSNETNNAGNASVEVLYILTMLYILLHYMLQISYFMMWFIILLCSISNLQVKPSIVFRASSTNFIDVCHENAIKCYFSRKTKSELMIQMDRSAVQGH